MANLSIRRAIFGVTLSACLVSLAGLNRLNAQGTTAVIQGTVADSTGAVVAGATVEIKNTGTGATQTTTTGADGRYLVPDLAVGDYEVQATQAGFSTVVHRGITLTVGGQSVVDFALPVGQQQQTVTVEGEASQVETRDAAVGSLVTQQQMVELPLNGRNFEQLILLAPGVQTVTAFSGSSIQGRAAEYSIAGARPEGQNLLLDDEAIQGYWNKGMGSITGSSLGIEAIGEFQTLTNSFSAQFAGNGAVVNSVSKSGTNSFHGSVYEFVRNNFFDARTFFTPTSSAPVLRRNQYGGSIGGPVKKDKMFFFVNYEGLEQSVGETKIADVPAGNPVITATNPVIAQSIAETLAIYPKPTALISSTVGTYTFVPIQPANEEYVLGRFDYAISSADFLFVRYISDKAHLTEPFGGGYGGGNFPYWPEQDNSHSQFITAEWRRIVSPTAVNVARIAFSRPVAQATTSTSVSPALQFFPGAGRPDGDVSITGLSTVGASGFPFAFVPNTYTAGDDILWTKGAHSIRLGISVDRILNNTYYPQSLPGTFSFQSLPLFLAGTALSFSGAPDTPGLYANRDFRETAISPYAQWDWKVTPKLTLNLGVRWEFMTNPTAAHNSLYEILNYATATGTYNPNGTWTGYKNVSNVFVQNPTWLNFDPRFGFAYDVFADHKTSIRGGFGLFHDPISTSTFGGGFYSAAPWALDTQLSPTYPFPFTAITPSLPSGSSPFNYNTNTTPYMIQYNLNVQREIAPSTVLSVGYIGSNGVHLMSMLEQNPPIPTVTNGVDSFASLVNGNIVVNPRLNPNLSTFPAFSAFFDSHYESLQAALNHRFSRDFSLQVGDTWSSCIDNGSFWGSFNSNSPATVENPYNFALDRGPCSFNQRQTFHVNGLIALPFRGNKFVEGWQFSSIISASTGTPFNISDGVNQAGYSGSGTPRPNYISGCKVAVGDVNEWFNPACFSLEAPGTLGNLGRDVGVGPGFFDGDLALLKDTKVRENLRLQFRAEFFNILNHTNFGLPAASLFTAGASGACTASGAGCGNLAATAGRITSIVGNPRQMQFALKLIF